MKKEICKEVKWQIVICAIICIAGLMGYALFLGRNGLLLTATIGVIAALAGVAMPTPKILTIK